MAGKYGAIGPDDPRGQRFGAMGRGACLLFPQGSIYNEHHIQIGSETLVGPNTCITAGMAPGQEMPTNPVVSIDGLELKQFDYIDIGELLESSGAVPVVIKSLIFPASAALGQEWMASKPDVQPEVGT